MMVTYGAKQSEMRYSTFIAPIFYENPRSLVIYQEILMIFICDGSF